MTATAHYPGRNAAPCLLHAPLEHHLGRPGAIPPGKRHVRLPAWWHIGASNLALQRSAARVARPRPLSADVRRTWRSRPTRASRVAGTGNMSATRGVEARQNGPDTGPPRESPAVQHRAHRLRSPGRAVRRKPSRRTRVALAGRRAARVQSTVLSRAATAWSGSAEGAHWRRVIQAPDNAVERKPEGRAEARMRDRLRPAACDGR
jgi:hypothetical protein